MEFLKCGDVHWKGPEKRNKGNVVATTAKHPDSRKSDITLRLDATDIHAKCHFLGENLLPGSRISASRTLSPLQRFKRSLYQSAVRSALQAQSRMDRSGGEPLPDVCRFLVHPYRFLVHRWISRLWLNLTAWNSQKPIANYVATVCICFFEV